MVSLALPFAAIILLSMTIQIALPHLLRPDNLFSVTIAPESRQHPEVRALIARWRICNAVIGLVAAGACAVTGLLPPSSSLFLLPVLLLVYFIVGPAIYVAFHRRALAFALPAEGRAQRVASLRPRPSGTLIPSRWELVPLCVIALTVILLALRYPTAPTVIPTHFDLTGHATGFAPKSIWTFFSIVGVQLGVWVILTILGVGLSMTRVAPSAGEAGASYRHMWTRLVFAIKTATVIELCIADLLPTSTQEPGALAGPLAVLPIAFLVTILALTLTLALRYGQSGWRQRRRTGAPMTARGDATPDSAWIGGLIYYNPDDPALFVEKRSGLGWTVNFGHPQARLILIGLLLVPLVLSLLPVLFQH
jgi:uncharacterized membrane protein